ncbi:hypothetical protein RQ479_18865 [Mesorhizobium sp. ISC25]|uniref:hypothetical protein n=1 Tax=Mesorhizobium sp. ISC25 TaxID=3077335 RepID=UPI0035DF0917
MLTPLQIRTTRCLDGLHYSFELLTYFHQSLHSICSKIPEGTSNVVPALAHCWGFVDTLHRIRSIVLALPTLSQKGAEIRAFLKATDLAETFRHYIQHLSSELSKAPHTFPVWGSIAWVDEYDDQKSHVALFGAMMGDTTFAGCVYDRLNKAWVSKVCLTVAQHSFNFDPIFEASVRFRDFVVPFIVDGGATPIELLDKPPIFTMRVLHSPEEQPNDEKDPGQQ